MSDRSCGGRCRGEGEAAGVWPLLAWQVLREARGCRECSVKHCSGVLGMEGEEGHV